MFSIIIVAYLATSSLIFGLLKEYWTPPLDYAPYLNSKCDACKGTFLNKAYSDMAISTVPFIINLCYLLLPKLDQAQMKNLEDFNTRLILTTGQKSLKWLLFLLGFLPTIIFCSCSCPFHYVQ